MTDGAPLELPDWIVESSQGGPVLPKVVEEIQLQLGSLATRLGKVAFDRDPIDDSGLAADCRRRLWCCLSYHWQRFHAISPCACAHVTSRIESGELPFGQVRVNVLEEVLLALGLERGHRASAERFERDYMPSVRHAAGKLGGARAIDAIDNFAAELILPREKRPPRIASYLGRTTLASWLRVVVTNYWVTHTRRSKYERSVDAPEVIAGDDPTAAADHAGCESLLHPVFHDATRAIGAEERLLLKMLVLDEVPQKQLAVTLGINSGNVTRRRQRAAESIWEQVRKLIAADRQPRRFEECLQLLLAGNAGELVQRLAQILAAGVRGDGTPGETVR